MMGTIRREYIAICEPLDVEQAKKIVDYLADAIIKEEKLKEMGICIEELTKGLF